MTRRIVRATFHATEYVLLARYPGSNTWRLVREGPEDSRWVTLADLRNYGLSDADIAQAIYEALAPPEGGQWSG